MIPLRIPTAVLAAACEGFLGSHSDSREETRATYRRALREFLKWHERDAGFLFRLEDVERYRLYLVEGRSCSVATIATYMTALRGLCEYLVKTGVLDVNPARVVHIKTRPRVHSREALSARDVARLLDAVPLTDSRGVRDYAIIKLMVGCALSEIEIVRANVADLDITGTPALLRVQGKGKATKADTVTLPPDVAEAVRRYFDARGTAEGPLFQSDGNRTRGMRMTTRGVRARVSHYLEITGIKRGRIRRVTPYSLRRTAAVLLAEAGGTADDVRRHLRLGTMATAMLYMPHGAQHDDGKTT